MQSVLIALFIWMPVAADKNGTAVNGWVYQTDFRNETRCLAAARELGVKPSNYRCIEK